MKVAPSILTANFCELGAAIRMLDAAHTDWIHLDIMDGNFVPNISFGPRVVKDIRALTNTFLDVHLMMNDPNVLIEDFAEAGADLISVHYEAPGCVHLDRTVQHIHALGKKAGIVLNPATPVSVLEYILDELDLVLLMSVNPGFGGQKFIPYVLRKTESLAEMIAKRGLHTEIELDGGVKPENAGQMADAGATVLVAGTAVMNASDPAEAIRLIQSCDRK